MYVGKDTLAAYLKAQCRGRKTAVSGAGLERALQTGGNELRRQVNRLRRQGVPIASSRNGYFYAVTAGEIYETIRQLRRMERGLAAAVQGLEASLDCFGGDAD